MCRVDDERYGSGEQEEEEEEKEKKRKRAGLRHVRQQVSKTRTNWILFVALRPIRYSTFIFRYLMSLSGLSRSRSNDAERTGAFLKSDRPRADLDARREDCCSTAERPR